MFTYSNFWNIKIVLEGDVSCTKVVVLDKIKNFVVKTIFFICVYLVAKIFNIILQNIDIKW